MKTNFVLALVISCFLWSCYEDDQNLPNEAQSSSEIDDFLDSEYGLTTLQNHGLTAENLDLECSKKDFFESKGVTAFAIPIVKEGIIIGRLNAFIVLGNDQYRAIVEEWESINDREYLATVTTGYGAYLATVSIYSDGCKNTQNILEIASVKNPKVMSKAVTKESWWACTTRVYETAKKACNGDSQCDFLCDIVDIAAGCTISMAAAAAISCI